ncbi:hypothetical protein IOLA_180 [uncultured bacterium]|nr:hypothetical protein IOLA_180 [uncultured bacterium]
MISKAIYYQAFIPKYNILNNGIDFTRTLQSINKYEDGFNVIIFHNSIFSKFNSYLFSRKCNRINAGIYNSELIENNNSNLFNINYSCPIITINLNKIEDLLRNNKIKFFILDIENILKKNHANENFIENKLNQIKSIILNTNINNINISSSQIVLKLISLISYIKICYECSNTNTHNYYVLKELNKYISNIVENVTNYVSFKSLKYNSINNFYKKILSINDFLNTNLLVFRKNFQICFAKYLFHLYTVNILKVIKYIFLSLINIFLYFLIYLFLIIFILISTIIKISIDILVYILT